MNQEVLTIIVSINWPMEVQVEVMAATTMVTEEMNSLARWTTAVVTIIRSMSSC